MFYNASSASAFVDRIGVNVHVSWPGVYPYADTAKVISAMNYLGLQNMRDYMNADTVGIYNKLADAGFHFDLMYNQQDNLAGYVTQVHNLEVAHPGSVLTLEGVNEINNNISSAIAWQKDIFTRVNADPVLANKPVIAPSLSGADPAVYGQLQVGAYSDYGNIHEYWGNGQPAYGWSPSDSAWWWSTWVKDGQISVPGKPVAVTETGISTANAGGGVDPTVQAKEILNAVMDAAKNGAPFTYLYELASSQNAGPSDPESNFGLYNYDWTAKPAAVALHNFTSILTDGGDLSGPAGGLDYAIQGVPQWGGQMLFQEGDGSQDIVVWAEPDIWNEGSRTVVAAPNTPITIDLATAASVAIYDPMKGSTPVQVLGTTSHITFNVTDHPLIVEIKPVSGSSGAAAPTSPIPPTTSTSPPPAPSTPDLAAASDAGVSNTDNVTKDNTPTLIGTAAAGATVKVFDGSVLVGSGAADASGAWSVTTSALADGTHTLTATAGNVSGTSAASAGLSVRIDTWAPSAPTTPDLAAASDNGSSSADNVTSVTTPVFTGTVASAPNAVVTLYDGATAVGSATVDGAGAWSITSAPLAVGSHAISAVAMDVAGNVSQSSGALSVSIVSPVSSPALVAGQNIVGGRWNDDLVGSAGPDTINGGRGADTIAGGAGDDMLTGGRQADAFMFQPGFGRDVITDFTQSEGDRMVFSGLGAPQTADTSAGLQLSFASGDVVTLGGVHSLASGAWVVN